MSWQDELRKLDEELAAGHLSADDYRVRRDQVLSSAVESGSPAPAQTGQPPSEATTVMPAIGNQQPQQQGGDDQNAEETQIVARQQSEGGERTQVVGGWQAARPQQPGGDAERTQLVHGQPGPMTPPPGQQMQPPPQQPRGTFNPPPSPTWNTPQQDDSLWGGQEFPPLAAGQSTPDWVRQGPEIFSGSSSKGKKLLITGLVVLLVAAIGVGAYFVFFNKNSTDGGTANGPTTPVTTTSAPPPTTTTPVDPYEAALRMIPPPPGQLEQQSKILTVDELVSKKLMTKAEANLLKKADVTKVPWKSAKKKTPEDGPAPDVVSAMVIQTPSPEAARKLLGDLRKYQENSANLQYIKEPLPNMPPTMIFEKLVVRQQAVYRGLYVSGDKVIRINAVQKPFKEKEDALSGTYRNMTDAMLRAFPAD